MKFAHLADSHLGVWNDPILGEINLQCFDKAMQMCIDEEVDFVLISGDLFETSRPSIDVMDRAVTRIREVRDAGIRVYVTEGSHDFSATGKTMLRVLENAGLFVRVAKGKRTEDNKLRLSFVTDEKTGVKITGLVGRMGSLETDLYKNLDRDALLEEDGFKIFMFHSGLSELKPDLFKQAESMPISLLPKGFDYYAGGHIHKNGIHKWKNYGPIVFPGPTMPTNFRELESLGTGGFYITTVESGRIVPEWKDLDFFKVTQIQIDADDKNPKTLEIAIEERIDSNLKDKIVLLRVEGTLKTGKPSDIDFRRLISLMKAKGAKVVKKNIGKLTSAEYKEIKVTTTNREELEDKLIAEHAGHLKIKGINKTKEIQLTKELVRVLAMGKGPDDTKKNHLARIESDIVSILGIADEWEAFE
ncbi:MAG: metallophosphoesterase family protein [Candidatus Thorarchaeota archaeon]